MPDEGDLNVAASGPTSPETHQRRSVPVPRFLAEELAKALAGKGPDDLVFTSPQGGVLRNTNFRPRFFDPPPSARVSTG